MIVYKVTSPSNKVYIGITSQTLNRRKSEHKYKAKNKNTPFYNCLKKYKDKLIWEIIDDSASSWEELCKLEQYYIDLYKSCNKKFGYNCTQGGEGTLGIKISEERKILYSKLYSGSGNPFFGKKHSQETLEKLKNKKLSEESINKIIKTSGGRVFDIFDVDYKYIATYINIAKCARDLNLKRRKIQDCLQSKRKSTGGYRFVYKEILP